MESLTRPFFHHRRKLSSAGSTNSNGYDDILLGGQKSQFGGVPGFAASRKVAAEDYAEIFGGRNVSRGSSIPVLQLSDLDERHGLGEFRSSGSSKLDYSTIFGGFGGSGGAGTGSGGDDVAVDVPPYEELFNGPKRVKTDKANARIFKDTYSPLKGSNHFHSSEKDERQSPETPEELFDGGKQFNMSYHKAGQRRKDGVGGTTHIAQLHAVPGFTYIVDETACLQKIEQDKAVPQVKPEVSYKQGSIHHLQKTELDKEMSQLKARVSHSQKSSDCLQKKEKDKEMPPLKSQVSHDQSFNDCLKKTAQDKSIPPVKLDITHNRSCGDCQQSTVRDKAMPPVTEEVNHNRSSSFNLSEGKSGTRAKWQLPTVQASESLLKDNGESYRVASCTSGELLNMAKSDMKLHPCNMFPPSSIFAGLKESEEHPKLSKSSSYGPNDEASEKGTGGYSTPFSDEELDINSAAAAPAAALKKAIEQAQESIRIAKEIMERKRDSAQTSIPHSKHRLKTEGRSEMKHVQEANNIKEKNVNEACNVIDKEVLDVCGGNQNLASGSDEVALSFKDVEEPSTGRQGEVAVNGENVEVAEENGMAMWFSQLLSNGKHRMATLASELVGKKTSTIQPLDKEERSINEPMPAKITMEGETCEKVNAGDRIIESGNEEAKLNALGRSDELERKADSCESSLFADLDKVSETLIFSQEDELTIKAQANLVDEQKCKEKHEDRHEPMYEGHFEPELGNRLPENDFLNLKEKSPDQEGEERLEDIYICRVDSRKRLEDDTGESSDGYHNHETDEERSRQSVTGEEKQIMSEEEHTWEPIDRRSAGSFQSIEENGMDEGVDSSSAHQKIEMNEEVPDVGDSWDQTADNAENPRVNLCQEAAESLDRVIDAYNIDQSANIDDSQEARRSEVENCSEKNSREEKRNNEEVAQKVETAKSVYEFEEDARAPQAFDEEFKLKGKEVLETSCLNGGSTQENTKESSIRVVPEVLASDEKTADFGFKYINYEVGLSEDGETATTTDSVSDSITEDGTDGEDRNDVPAEVDDLSNSDSPDISGENQLHENDTECAISIKSESYIGLVDEGFAQKQIEENDRVSESRTNPESCDGLVHECGENAESIHMDNIAHGKEVEKDTTELHFEERKCFKGHKEPGDCEFPVELKWDERMEANTEMKTGQRTDNNEVNGCKTFAKEEKEIRETVQKEEAAKDCFKRTEINKREREREKDRIAVERAIREARERAFAEARERAERAAVEKATAEVRQRAMAEAREKVEKVSAAQKVPTGKASTRAKLRAERAAVERATAEARERALEKALSQKTTSEMRMQAERNVSGKVSGASRDNGLKHSFSSSDLDKFDGTNSESAQRRKARLERHQRIMERAAKALAEKNFRDVLAQREQAERNRLAETLDADIKRWASGKEGNLRALLSTLQYILGPNSGWQPITLTEIVTTNAVKKAYRKATLYVHPDKLQQRGASIQQKYICEKVFDLLKAAWNKFNSEER